jgi:hypothetical protein
MQLRIGEGAASRVDRGEGLGNAGGFKLMVEATGDVNYDALQGQADNLAAKRSRATGRRGTNRGGWPRGPAGG